MPLFSIFPNPKTPGLGSRFSGSGLHSQNPGSRVWVPGFATPSCLGFGLLWLRAAWASGCLGFGLPWLWAAWASGCLGFSLPELWQMTKLHTLCY